MDAVDVIMFCFGVMTACATLVLMVMVVIGTIWALAQFFIDLADDIRAFVCRRRQRNAMGTRRRKD